MPELFFLISKNFVFDDYFLFLFCKVTQLKYTLGKILKFLIRGSGLSDYMRE